MKLKILMSQKTGHQLENCDQLTLEHQWKQFTANDGINRWRTDGHDDGRQGDRYL